MSTTQTTAARKLAYDVEAVRRDFPILHKPLPNGKRLVYLDSGASAQKPQQVIDKVTECYTTYYANAHRGIYQLGARTDEELEGARGKVQRLLNAAEPEEIIFTSGTTMSINLVANAWGRKFLKAGDEILVNEMEHHANLVPWQQIAREKGASLKYIPLTMDGRLDLEQLDTVLSRKTRLVAVTGMSNVLGTINPIDVLAARAKQVGALILVDAAQSAPHLPIDVRNTQVDFLAFSGHKLYGPSGIGVLYGRREILEAMDPFLCGGAMIYEVFRDYSTFADIPAKFEAGTLPIVQAIGMGAAIDYVQALGFENLHAHEMSLLRRLHEKLGEIPGVRIYGPSVEHKGGIVSFTVDGVHPHDLADLMDRRGVAVRAGHHCTMPLHALLDVPATARASLGCYNNEADVDALVEAVHYARHTFRLE